MPPFRQKSNPQRWAVHGGLVAPEWRGFWRDLAVATPLWEGGGIFPHDVSPNKVTGDLDGSTPPTWEPGPHGQSLHFAGSGDSRVDWSDSGVLDDLTGSLSTLVIWKRDSGGGFRMLVTKRSATNNNSLELDFNADTPTFRWLFYGGGAERVISSSTVPAVGTYNITVATRVLGGAMVLYNNGVEVAAGSFTQTPSNPSVNLNLGVFNNINNEFVGEIALFCLWKRALTSGEALAVSRDPFGMFRMWRPLSASVISAVAAARRIFITGG